MDRQEVGEWIMPTDYDPVEAEAKHLIYHADDNKVCFYANLYNQVISTELLVKVKMFSLLKDGQLQEKEVLDHHTLFVGSQALNYGRPLGHEEL